MIKIRLYNKAELFALVDDIDYALVNQWNWYQDKAGYIVRRRPYKSNLSLVRLHRFIMGEPKGKEVDHINHNKLDNTRNNLRICSRSENAKSRKLNKDSTSGYRGLSWDEKNNKWRATVIFNGKFVLRKRFESKNAAILATNWTRRLYYRNFSGEI